MCIKVALDTVVEAGKAFFFFLQIFLAFQPFPVKYGCNFNLIISHDN